jgi:hypothetical protein
MRRILYRATNSRLKTEGEAEEEIRNSILALGLPFLAAHATFLAGKGPWLEVTALVNGEPLCVELLTCSR